MKKHKRTYSPSWNSQPIFQKYFVCVKLCGIESRLVHPIRWSIHNDKVKPATSSFSKSTTSPWVSPWWANHEAPMGSNSENKRSWTKSSAYIVYVETWRKFGKTNTLHRRHVINSCSLIKIDKKRNCFEGTTKTYMFLPKALKAKHLYNSKAPVDALTMGIGRLVKNMLQAKQLGGLIPIYIYIYV